MPLFKGKGFKSMPHKAIAYITNEKKAEIISTYSLSKLKPYAKQFSDTAKLHGKYINSNERKYYHFKFSPDPKDMLTPEQVHSLAEEIVQNKFNKYECIVATHTDKAHIHSHIIFNAVNFIDGKKYHCNSKEDALLKDYANDIAKEKGLSTLEWRHKQDKRICLTDCEKRQLDRLGRQEFSKVNLKEYIRQNVDESLLRSENKQDLLQELKKRGIECPRYTDKTITFEYGNIKIRGNKLGERFTAEKINSYFLDKSRDSFLEKN